MKNLDLKKSDAVKSLNKKHLSNADVLAQILAVPFDEKFAAEMQALRAAAIAGGMKTLNDEELTEYVLTHDERHQA